MIRSGGRHIVIPAIMQVQTHAPRTAAAAAASWWEAGGAPTPYAAYQAIGAASYAASLVNLANPGTADFDELTSSPSWASNVGWSDVGGLVRLLTSISSASDDWVLLIRWGGTPHGSQDIVGVAYDSGGVQIRLAPNWGSDGISFNCYGDALDWNARDYAASAVDAICKYGVCVMASSVIHSHRLHFRWSRRSN